MLLTASKHWNSMHVNCFNVAYALIWLLSAPLSLVAMRRGDSVFFSTELISFIDPLKHGFHIILTEEANQYLLVNPLQLPAIYVTAIPLDSNSEQTAYRQILYRDGIHNKMIKILGLHEKSWYYVCLEYETISVGSVQNQTTGTQCRIQRTLDKFGKAADSTVTDVKLQTMGDTILEFQFFVDSSFPLKLTTYLEDGSVPLRSYVIEKPKMLTVSYSDLQPNTIYGRLCLIEEPLTHAYSAMGRSIAVQLRNCFLSKDLKTKISEYSYGPSAQVVRSSRNSDLGRNIASSNLSLSLSSLCAVVLSMALSFLTLKQ